MTPTTRLTAAALVLFLAAPGLAVVQGEDYRGAGVVVTSFSGTPGTPSQTILDNGAVVCRDNTGDGVPDTGNGGYCLPFDRLNGDSVLVRDDQVGLGVVFQVCIDNNGDGLCGGGGRDGAAGLDPCADTISFSHSTQTGANVNPLFVNPAGSRLTFTQCNSQGFPGYIVITCAGAHGHGANPAASHTHHVTQGSVVGVLTGGTAKGDFCGAPTAVKAYEVV